MVSTRASGTTTIRYGGMSRNVLALEVVLADGSIVRCGTRAPKSSAGYDLVRMFTGSEGTLGLITEITLRLHARPLKSGCVVCAFPTLGDAIATVVELNQWGLPLLRIEFLDDVQIRACNRYSRLDLVEKPTLFIEVAGEFVAEHTERIRTVATQALLVRQLGDNGVSLMRSIKEAWDPAGILNQDLSIVTTSGAGSPTDVAGRCRCC